MAEAEGIMLHCIDVMQCLWCIAILLIQQM
jgi:hypothetical protein